MTRSAASGRIRKTWGLVLVLRSSILKAEMSLLHRLALRVGWELARRPETRAKVAQTLAKTQRILNDDIKPRAQRAWREAKPEIEHAKRRLTHLAKQVRDEYRKGHDRD